MSPSSELRCPRCGALLDPASAEGLCAPCLVALSLVPETEASNPCSANQTAVVKSAPDAPPSAAEIARHFPQLEILECLGRGGMGVVYKARQPHLNRFVALKVLPPEKDQDAAFAERFAREAQLLARLSHQHIVTIYDFGKVDGLYYLLMEYVDGVSLRQLLQTRKMSPEDALAIVPSICEALQYAHEQGVVHRDIKPENVLLNRKGQVKIADFGIAKMIGSDLTQPAITQDQQVIGTPHYMAPEQVEKPHLVDHRADIYSLGVVFYEMLTGELPLGKFQPPSCKVQVDVRMDDVVLKALEKEPERRYQQAHQVKTDVETIAGTPAAPAQTAASSRHNALAWKTSIFPLNRRSTRGRKTVVVGTAASCLILVLGLSRLFLPASPNSPPAAPFANQTADPRVGPQFEVALAAVKQHYPGRPDAGELTEAAIGAMVGKLDPYAAFGSTQAMGVTIGEFEPEQGGMGISVKFDPETRQLIVATPMPDSPAFKAGIRAGDCIVEIDGKPVADFPPGKKLITAIGRLRGPPGQTVTVGVTRNGSDTVARFTLVRELIVLPNVKGDTRNPDGSWNFMLDDARKIGYLRLVRFGSRSAAEMETALRELESRQMKSLILDLRANSGGSLTQAVQIADFFLDSGVIVRARRPGPPEQVWYAKPEGTFNPFPMAVLVDALTAAAGEVLAACLQDHQRAVVIGERTFGKGSVQGLFPLGDGNALRLTTAGLFRPSGGNLDRVTSAGPDDWGVKPNENLEVKLSGEEKRQYYEDRGQRDNFGAQAPPTPFTDRVLQRALEYLQSVSP